MIIRNQRQIAFKPFHQRLVNAQNTSCRNCRFKRVASVRQIIRVIIGSKQAVLRIKARPYNHLTIFIAITLLDEGAIEDRNFLDYRVDPGFEVVLIRVVPESDSISDEARRRSSVARRMPFPAFTLITQLGT